MSVIFMWLIWCACTVIIHRASYGVGYLTRSIEIGEKRIAWLQEKHTDVEYDVFSSLDDWGNEKKAYWSTHFVWLQKVIKKYTGYEINTN